MKICLVISSLTCGGAERVVATHATKLVELGHDVTIITMSSVETDFYTIPSAVNRVGLDIMRGSNSVLTAVKNNLFRLKAIRNAVKRADADVVVSHLMETNVLVLLASLGTKNPIIVTEHCDPTYMSYGKVWWLLRRMLYPISASVVSVSAGVGNYFEWLSQKKRQVIYNPFFTPREDANLVDAQVSGLNADDKLIVSMGRLTDQKKFDLLINAFAKISHSYPDWKLVILGDGELREELQELVVARGIEAKVLLPGRIKNPFVLLRKADLFVMSSKFEGFPMAHGEAMLCGLPVVATDCPSGPSELIRDQIDGILVPNGDVFALQNAMDRLMSDDVLREQMSKSAKEVSDRFDTGEIIEKWISLFQKITLQR